jgi:hypothetical protein
MRKPISRESHRTYGLWSYVRCTYREPFWRVPWNPYVYGYESVSSRTSANALELSRGAPSQFGVGSDHLLGVSFSDINHAAPPHMLICPQTWPYPVPYRIRYVIRNVPSGAGSLRIVPVRIRISFRIHVFDHLPYTAKRNFYAIVRLVDLRFRSTKSLRFC